jgi:hypothetical protein
VKQFNQDWRNDQMIAVHRKAVSILAALVIVLTFIVAASAGTGASVPVRGSGFYAAGASSVVAVRHHRRWHHRRHH